MQAREAKESGSTLSPGRLITVTSDTPVKRAFELMRDAKIHHLVVMNDGDFVGTISTKELVADVGEADWFGNGRTVTVAEVMRLAGPVIDETTDVKTALSHMIERGVTALPMTAGGKITGIITETDMLRLVGKLLDSPSGVQRAINRGESVIANPLVQNLMKAFGDAGI